MFFVIAPSLQGLEPPANPVRFSLAPKRFIAAFDHAQRCVDPEPLSSTSKLSSAVMPPTMGPAPSRDTYLRYTGQVDDEGFKLTSNSESSGRKHTNWLNMMLPRLKLARNLLSDVGLLVRHIDEHEFSNFVALIQMI